MGAEITNACPEDLNAVLTRLAETSLPRHEVSDHFQHFLVAREGGRVIGSVGMERYGKSILPRSLALGPEYRDQGLGRALTNRLLQEAREQGVRRVFLQTETAPEFFPKFGFRRIAREEADAAVRGSTEFRTACSQSAVCMSLNL